MAEDGVIPDRYPLEVLAGAGYAARTRKNVEDSDGTLILHFGPLSAGTLFTLEVCEELLRPVCLVDGKEEDTADAAVRVDAFIEDNDIQRMNVAGPRASHAACAHDYARDVIGRVLVTRLKDDGGAGPTPMKSQ